MEEGEFALMKRRRGFTLLELLVAISVIVSISVVTFLTSKTVTTASDTKATQNVLVLINEQLLRYHELTGSFPADNDAFKAFLRDTNYFDAVPVNSFWPDAVNPENGWKYTVSGDVATVVPLKMTPQDPSGSQSATIDSMKITVTNTTSFNDLKWGTLSYGGDP